MADTVEKATEMLLAAFPGSLVEAIEEPVETGEIFNGPFGVCGWCHRGTYAWTAIAERPIPMHRGCIENWTRHELGMDNAPARPPSVRLTERDDSIPTEARGVYGRWAERRDSGK